MQRGRTYCSTGALTEVRVRTEFTNGLALYRPELHGNHVFCSMERTILVPVVMSLMP